MVRFGSTLLAAAAVLAIAPATAPAASWRVTIRNPGDALGETPIFAAIKESVPAGGYSVETEGRDLPVKHAQVLSDSGQSYIAFVLKSVPARGELRFTLAPETSSPQSRTGVKIRPDGKDLEVSVGGSPLTVYRGDGPNKPYFYPVIGPNGSEFTRAFPIKKDVAGEARDHPHQRSFWFTHGHVNGVDFWASDPINGDKPNFGTIHETSRNTVSGVAVGLIRTTDDWLDHGGKKVLEDERAVRFYDTERARVIDFDVVLKATNGPVTFGDTKEGMFGLRVASSMDVKNKTGGKITNAEGVTDDAAWGKASPWVDYTGPVAGRTVGVAILNHPESFRYPTTWHVRPYGLFAANPFGWHDFGLKKSGEYTIPAGESIRFRYRVVLHDGETASAQIPVAFRAYTEPPVVELKAE
jgi:hypothetical protein